MIETPDVEDGVRRWLKSKGIDAFFGLPDTLPATFVTVTRIGGGPEIGKDAALDVARLSLQCWGGFKKEAGDLARRVTDLVTSIEGTQLSDNVLAYGASVDMILWQPAVDTARSRYIVDCTITARATVPASP